MAVLEVRDLNVILHCTESVISVCDSGTDELGLDYLERQCENGFFFYVARMIGYN